MPYHGHYRIVEVLRKTLSNPCTEKPTLVNASYSTQRSVTLFLNRALTKTSNGRQMCSACWYVSVETFEKWLGNGYRKHDVPCSGPAPADNIPWCCVKTLVLSNQQPLLNINQSLLEKVIYQFLWLLNIDQSLPNINRSLLNIDWPLQSIFTKKGNRSIFTQQRSIYARKGNRSIFTKYQFFWSL